MNGRGVPAGPGGTADRDFDFVIVGAGVTGLIMASLLLARGLAEPGRVAVLAQGTRTTMGGLPESEWDVRVFALSRASQRLLSLSGAWQLVPDEKICAYERMCVWAGAPGSARAASLSFDSAELGEPNLGYIVEGRALEMQCRRAAAAAGVVFIEAGIAECAADDSAIQIRLSDGRTLSGRLLIAADGAESATRKLLKIETAGHSYHQEALVAHVRIEKTHQHTAWQCFLPTGPLAFLPLPDGRASIVWSMTRAEARRLRVLDHNAFGQALTAASDRMLGSCELTTPLSSFPLRLQYALDYARPRAVLVGDAAHAVHPLAGQGLNMGLLDCASLASMLGESGELGYGGDHRVLRRYERSRRSENLLAATAMDGLERLFSGTHPGRSWLRGAGLGAVGGMPFIKRALVARALGIAGDVPDFLRVVAP